MLEINRKIYMFNSKEIWFADYPFDVEGYDSATFMECKNKVDRAGFTRREHTTLVIDLTQNLDTIWRNMGKKSCRYEINRAKREEVIVKINQDYNRVMDVFSSIEVIPKPENYQKLLRKNQNFLKQ